MPLPLQGQSVIRAVTLALVGFGMLLGWRISERMREEVGSLRGYIDQRFKEEEYITEEQLEDKLRAISAEIKLEFLSSLRSETVPLGEQLSEIQVRLDELDKR